MWKCRISGKYVLRRGFENILVIFCIARIPPCFVFSVDENRRWRKTIWLEIFRQSSSTDGAPMASSYHDDEVTISSTTFQYRKYWSADKLSDQLDLTLECYPGKKNTAVFSARLWYLRSNHPGRRGVENNGEKFAVFAVHIQWPQWIEDGLQLLGAFAT